jgi:hypothetical protein
MYPVRSLAYYGAVSRVKPRPRSCHASVGGGVGAQGGGLWRTNSQHFRAGVQRNRRGCVGAVGVEVGVCCDAVSEGGVADISPGLGDGATSDHAADSRKVDVIASPVRCRWCELNSRAFSVQLQPIAVGCWRSAPGERGRSRWVSFVGQLACAGLGVRAAAARPGALGAAGPSPARSGTSPESLPAPRRRHRR